MLIKSNLERTFGDKIITESLIVSSDYKALLFRFNHGRKSYCYLVKENDKVVFNSTTIDPAIEFYNEL